MKINPYPNPFIVIEGPDGCGKSTLIEGLERWDKEKNIGAIFTKEPTDGVWGGFIRALLENDCIDMRGKKVESEDLQKLYIKDRLEHRKIEAVFLEKYPVFSDRDFPSTMAYGMAEGLEPEWILEAHKSIMGEYFFVPDLVLILDLPAEEAVKRSQKTGKGVDYFDKKIALQKKIREAYLSFPGLIKEHYSTRMDIRIINAMPSPREVLKMSLVWIDDIFQKKMRLKAPQNFRIKKGVK